METISSKEGKKLLDACKNNDSNLNQTVGFSNRYITSPKFNGTLWYGRMKVFGLNGFKSIPFDLLVINCWIDKVLLYDT